MPVVLVGHSMGGLVARAAAIALRSQAESGQCGWPAVRLIRAQAGSHTQTLEFPEGDFRHMNKCRVASIDG